MERHPQKQLAKPTYMESPLKPTWHLYGDLTFTARDQRFTWFRFTTLLSWWKRDENGPNPDRLTTSSCCGISDRGVFFLADLSIEFKAHTS